MKATIPHCCHVPGCSTPVPRKLLMCPKHWKKVPIELRKQVWYFYQPGQEKGIATVTPEYVKAAEEAIKAVGHG